MVCKAPEWRTYSDVEALVAAFSGRGEPLFAALDEALDASSVHALAAALEVQVDDDDDELEDDHDDEAAEPSGTRGEEADQEAENNPAVAASTALSASTPPTSPKPPVEKLSAEELARATKEAFAAAKAAEANAVAEAEVAADAAAAEAARAWEEDPRRCALVVRWWGGSLLSSRVPRACASLDSRWSAFTVEVQQGPDRVVLGIRHLAWRDLVGRRTVAKAAAAPRPTRRTEDGNVDPVAANIATVLTLQRAPSYPRPLCALTHAYSLSFRACLSR